MAARRPPNAFSNELAVWIGDTYTSSIVFVELKPKDAKKLKHFWDVVSPILGEPDRSGPKNDQRLKKCEDLQCCTGFVIRNTAGSLWILTCAHVLGPAFNNKRPITAAQVNDLFDLKILCDHNEQRYQMGVVQNAGLQRTYMAARVYRTNGPTDLMLLRVAAQEVQNCCGEPHRVLCMAPMLPDSMSGVVMLSWPVDGNRTAVLGEVSHHSRPFSTLFKNHPCEFQMRLSQIDMTSEVGSSGAPLLTGSADYCGVLYGGNGRFSFVSLQDIRATFTAWGLPV